MVFNLIRHVYPVTQQGLGVSGIEDVLYAKCLGGSEGRLNCSIGLMELLQVGLGIPRSLLGIALDALYIKVISFGVVDYSYRKILYLQSPDRFGP